MSYLRRGPARLLSGEERPSFSFGVPTQALDVLSVLLLVLFLAWWMKHLLVRLHDPVNFDDSYMFYRYAVNIRRGLGVSWNLDGVHTYGQTAPLWGGVVLLLSYLPFTQSHALILGSSLCSVGGLLAMAWAVARNAQGILREKSLYALSLIAYPLARKTIFGTNSVTGMETMLALLLSGVYVGLVMAWHRQKVRSGVAGFCGLLLFLTRPEAAALVVLFPLALSFLSPPNQVSRLARLLGVFFAGVLLDLGVCKLYFHTALPLSFYMKSGHGYEGYARNWAPVTAASVALSAAAPYLGCIALFGRRQDWRLLLSFFVPGLVVLAYLCSVNQIMGGYSRYYIPYLPLLVVPALLVLDRRTAEAGGDIRPRWSLPSVVKHVVVAVLVVVFFTGRWSSTMAQAADARMGKKLSAYDPVLLDVPARTPLPRIPYSLLVGEVARRLVAPLPPGATVAASEVGYLGAIAPQVNIIDIAGLNDTEIAVHGFTMESLLARRPDIIWMPHYDYTYQRGEMLTDPMLLRDYDLYAGAANYGLAIRKDGRAHDEIVRQMQELWDHLYPGYVMNDYLVRSASWTRQKHAATSSDDNF